MLPSKFLLPPALKLKPFPGWDALSIWGSFPWPSISMSSSSSADDGLSSILQRHKTRTTQPVRSPSILGILGGSRGSNGQPPPSGQPHPHPNHAMQQNEMHGQQQPQGMGRGRPQGQQGSPDRAPGQPPSQGFAPGNWQNGHGIPQQNAPGSGFPNQFPMPGAHGNNAHWNQGPPGGHANSGQWNQGPPGANANNGHWNQGPPGGHVNSNQWNQGPPGATANNGHWNQGPPGAHVNSRHWNQGPPGGHANSGQWNQGPPGANANNGHWNQGPPGGHVNSGQWSQGPPGATGNNGHWNQGPPGAHVNSGHWNQGPPGGHANSGQWNQGLPGAPGPGRDQHHGVRGNGIGENQVANGQLREGLIGQSRSHGTVEGTAVGAGSPHQWNNGIGQGHTNANSGLGNQGFNGVGHQSNLNHQNVKPGGARGNIPPSKSKGYPTAETGLRADGVVTIQKPGQSSQSFWKIDAETKPGGEYDSRWAKKFEQRFGQPAAQPHPSPLQFIQAAAANQAHAEKSGKPPRKEVHKDIVLPEDVTVKQLAQKLGIEIPKLEAVLTEVGEQPQSHEDKVSFDAAELAAAEFNKAVVRTKATGPCQNAVHRPAVVTVLGHVDHGKTTLLDCLRKTSVAAGEAGGITQHIGAFEVVMPDSQNSLTFLDTPGHAAFSAMRARGARVTDLAVLVVAADDGVMPQTKEALRHAREANCPFVVAITKVDVPQANVKKVKQQLIAEGVELEEIGGSIQVIEVAAPSGIGLRELEEALILQADLMELKAAVEGNVHAVVVEAHMNKGLGPVATIIMKSGTLRVGSSVAVGCQWGRVRVMKNAEGEELDTVLPGKPAEICGLRGVPQAGDELMVVCDDERAKRVAEARSNRQEIKNWQSPSAGASADNKSTVTGTTMEKPVVNIILKADTKGTAEAVRDAVLGLSGDVVTLNVLYAGVGPVCEADIMFAAATSSSVLSFNLKPNPEVQNIAQEQSIDVRQHSIIYRLLDDVGLIMSEVAPHFEEEVIQGEASVLQVFELKGKRNKTGSTVAGCKVVDGHLQKSGGTIRVMRGDEVIYAGGCASLKRHKLDVERVGKGSEFGAILDGFSTFQQGDVLQYVIVEKRKPKSEPVIGGGLRILPEASAQKIST